MLVILKKIPFKEEYECRKVLAVSALCMSPLIKLRLSQGQVCRVLCYYVVRQRSFAANVQSSMCRLGSEICYSFVHFYLQCQHLAKLVQDSIMINSHFSYFAYVKYDKTVATLIFYIFQVTLSQCFDVP